MRLTNSEVVQVHNSFSRLMEIKLPVKVSLDIAILLKQLEGLVTTFVLVRDKLFKTYSIENEKNEDGSITFKSTEEGKEKENLENFSSEFNELLEAKTEDTNFKTIKLPAEIGGKPLEIEPSILVELTRFVEVE